MGWNGRSIDTLLQLEHQRILGAQYKLGNEYRRLRCVADEVDLIMSQDIRHDRLDLQYGKLLANAVTWSGREGYVGIRILFLCTCDDIETLWLETIGIDKEILAATQIQRRYAYVCAGRNDFAIFKESNSDCGKLWDVGLGLD